MANNHIDPVWQAALSIADPTSGAQLNALIATARVSDGGSGEWALIGTLKGLPLRHVSARGRLVDGALHLYAISISTDKAAVDSDLQRYRVAERVGLPKGNPKPKPSRSG